MSLKKDLHTYCVNYVSERIMNAQNAIINAQESSNAESKSTAGDKHDTARAMMQLEVEKMSKQLAEAQKLKIALSYINPEIQHEEVQLGSIVNTSNAQYFISISAGIIEMQESQYFAISPLTPIGKLIIGLKKGDSFEFNGVVNKVISVE